MNMIQQQITGHDHTIKYQSNWPQRTYFSYIDSHIDYMFISMLTYDTLTQFTIGKRIITVIKKTFISPTFSG